MPMLSQDHHQPDTEEEWSQDSEEEVCIDTFKPSMYLKHFHLNLGVAFLELKYHFLPVSGAGDRNPGVVQGETHSVVRIEEDHYLL